MNIDRLITWENPEQLQTDNISTAKTVHTDCADLFIVNLGATTAFVNGFPLAPGATLSLGCNQHEINHTNLSIKAAPPTPGGSDGVWIWRKKFINEHVDKTA